MRVLTNHPAILRAPEPLVLVESLGAATVNLRILFWVDGNQHDWRRVKSSVIRLVKRAFQQAGISMPDDAREVLFPHGVPLRMVESQAEATHDGGRHAPMPPAPVAEPEAVATAAEGDLRSEEQQIQEQARQARSPEGSENLLQT
jgi:small-conductance mechanosensitive channel